MDTNKLYDIFIDKLGENKETIELLGFYLVLEKYGLEKISNVYDKDEITAKIEKIDDLNLFSEQEEKINYRNEIQLCNIEWLRYFVIYSQTYNSVETANLLNITTQGLNKALLGLEKHYKANLIERNKIAKGLTIPGRVFVEKARTILSGLVDIDKYFKELTSQEVQGTISVGTFNIGDLFCLDKTIMDFTDRYNDIYVKVDPLGSQKLEELILIGDIDIGITSSKPVNVNLESIKVAETRYIIVGKPQPKKTWSEYKYLISKQAHNSTPSVWPEQYKREIVGEISTRNLLIKLCKNGLGVITAPEIIVRDDIMKGELAIVADTPFESKIELYVIWSKNIYLTKIVRRFIAQLLKDFEITEGKME